jgi:hypothetical protein
MHRIREEEHKLFKLVRNLLGDQELMRLGAIMARKRRQRLDAQRQRSQEGRMTSSPGRAPKRWAGRSAPKRRLATSS